MYTGAIPNPTKTIQVNYPYQTCKELMDNFQSIIDRYKMGGYKIESKDEVLNTYVLSKGEILSFGVRIHINLQPSGDQTILNVEVQRLIGAFDQAHEIGMANRYLNEILKGISMGLNPPSEEEENKFIEQQNILNNSDSSLVWWFIIIMMVVLLPMCAG